MEDWKKLVAAAVEVLGAESAYSFGSSDSGGAFSTQLVVAVNNGDKARALMKDSVLFAERIMASSPTQPEFEVVLKQGVETYAGIPIDSFRFSLSLPEGTGEQEEFDAIMESMFGGSSLSLWVAVVDDLMVASYYAPTSQELRTLIDRVRKGAHGNLLGSAAFRSATGTLPAESLSLNYFSFPRFASLFTAVMAKAASEQNLPPWPLKEEDLSGMGISYTNRMVQKGTPL
jgi:hypothetical protein